MYADITHYQKVVQIDENGKLINVNLDIKNPNKKSDFEYKAPEEVMSSILSKERRIVSLMEEIQNVLTENIEA